MRILYILLPILLLLAFACDTPANKKQELEGEIHSFSIMAVGHRFNLEKRGDFILHLSKLSEAQKAAHNYDSLVKAQQDEAIEYKAVLDSLEIRKNKIKDIQQ